LSLSFDFLRTVAVVVAVVVVAELDVAVLHEFAEIELFVLAVVVVEGE
jgi:hypothetical protein